FFFSSRRRHTRSKRDWSSDVCSSDLIWNIPLLILIPLVIIVWMFFFYIYKQRTYKFKMIAQQYLSEGLKNQTSSLVLMLIIGVLIYSLNQTNFAVNVVEGINTL